MALSVKSPSVRDPRRRIKPQAARRPGRKLKKKADAGLSRTQRPKEMTLEAWQIALRRDYGREQRFEWRKIGSGDIFTDYAVTNPDTGRTYQITVRGNALGSNVCTCPDFSTNTLGTCKHVEFLLNRLSRRRAAKIRLAAGFQPVHSEVWLRFGVQRQVRLTLGTSASPRLRQAAAYYFDASGVMHPNGHRHFERFVEEAGQLEEELRCDDAALAFIAELRDAEHRRSLLDGKYSDGGLDGILKTSLYPYQCEGALFAAAAGRALLGDEMGLGKTIQALATAELMAREFNVERVLIVCPSSLKHQWLHEIQKFTDRSAVVVGGSLHARRAGYEQDAFFHIVNYDVIHRDLDAITSLSPDLVILDEAQRIKNWKTRAAQAVKSVESDYALVLTGTPLENRLEDLHSIVSFVDRHRLGPAFRFLSNHQILEEDSNRVVGYRNLAAIGETLKPILLRRRKSEVQLQLPPRMDKTFFVAMTPEQRGIHEENREVVARLVNKWKRHKFLSESDQRRLTIALLRMRMVCDNTYLVDHETRFGPKVDELMTLLSEVLEDADARVVVFTQWTRMQELVEKALDERGWGYVTLNGNVPSSERGELMRRFREDAEVRVFLSTDAGGVGLNLQAASCVVNLDLPWNPAVLEQRIARAHRIGQQRSVLVVNFVAEGTIEEGMLSVLGFKQALFAGVLDGGEDSVFLGGDRLQKFMESVQTISGSIPEPSPVDDVPEVRTSAEMPLEKPVAEHSLQPPVPENPSNPVAETPSVPEDLAGSTAGTESSAMSKEPVSPEEKPPSPPSRIPGDGASLAPLISAGAMLLKELGSYLASRTEPGQSPLEALTERDAVTGRTYLKVPMPEPEVVQTVVAAMAPLLELLQSVMKKG